MLVKTVLLIVSNPRRIEKLLSSVQPKVKNTVYIHLLSALTEPFGAFHPDIYNSWPKFSKLIYGIYSQAARHCQHLDVRVLLSGLKYKDLQQIRTNQQIDLVVFDKAHSVGDVEKFVETKIANKSQECNIITLTTEPDLELDFSNGNDKIYKHAVLGGTFDRLHMAHKLLLTEAALRSNKVTVGVTEENMLYIKTLWELIEPIEKRIKDVQDFLSDICQEIEINVVPITDPFGPTQHDASMDVIIVSAETVKGGQKVNEVREKNDLPPLDIVTVELIDEPFPNPYEETKISSSTTRMRLLGTLVKPVKENKNIPRKPYVIGLTGSIASGKSNVAQRMQEHGAKIIDCDKIGHHVYKKGKPCYEKLVEAFGQKIVGDDGEINRKMLGSIVFSDPKEMEKLNSIVWPSIADEVNEIVRKASEKVVVVEAAILTKAGWQAYCHEVWTTIVPETEAIKRLKVRNNLTEEQALSRLRAQDPVKKYVEASNVVFCSLWAVEYTYQQVDKAWNDLMKRLL